MKRFEVMPGFAQVLTATCAILGFLLLIQAASDALAQPRAPEPAPNQSPANGQETERRTGQNEQVLQANLDNVALRDFIKFVSRFTGRNIVYREDVIPNIKISVFSHTPITESDLMAIFQEVLTSANLTAIYRGDSLYILPDKQSRDLQHTFDPQAQGRGPGQELVTTVYRVSGGVSSKSAEAVLKPMASPSGLIMDIPQAQAVLMRDVRQRIDQMVRLLRSLESMQPKYKLHVFTLQKARADAAARKIQDLYKQLLERGREGDMPLVVAVEWSNSVIVSGTDAQAETVRGLVSQMDIVGEGATVMRVFRLQNAKAESAAKVLESLVQGSRPGGGGNGEEQAVQRSGPFQVSADPNTNSVVVIGDNEFLTRVQEIILKLDQPLDQVYVQALIMETSLENTSQFGVEWLVGGENGGTVGLGGFVSGPQGNLSGFVSPFLADSSTTGTTSTTTSVSALASGFNVGVLGNFITFEGKRFPTLAALINFLKTASGINILSAPQIMTLDNAEAEVFVGENRPFQTSDRSEVNNTVANVSSFDYRDVGIRLKVVPHINSESGLIRMDLEQEVKQVAPTLTTNSERPVTLNRTTRTSVQLLDGSTMVISGLMQNNSNQIRRAVPGAGDVPLLGWLFKTKNDSSSKTTLMVFVTARIIRTHQQVEALSQDKMTQQEALQRQSREFIKREYGDPFWDEKRPDILSPQQVIESFQRQPANVPPGAGGAGAPSAAPSAP